MILASASQVSALLTVACVAAYMSAATLMPRRLQGAWQGVMLFAWLLHGGALAWALWGNGSDLGHRFGFAPALSMTAWLSTAVYAIEIRVYPRLQGRWILGVLAAVAVVLAWLFPGTPLHNRASLWLPVHLSLGVASYGLFGVAVIHAWLMTRAEESIRHATEPHLGLPLLTLERLTFRFVTAGFVLLSATLMSAWLFGGSLYGGSTSWKWDHKTIFSVLSWLVFAILLLGRARLGWRGKRAVRVLYVGAGLLLLAYVGSRFVLEVLLGRVQ
ncbi:MAG: hypothetical protein RL459_1771 [Pseudomonadota bacterium]